MKNVEIDNSWNCTRRESVKADDFDLLTDMSMYELKEVIRKVIIEESVKAKEEDICKIKIEVGEKVIRKTRKEYEEERIQRFRNPDKGKTVSRRSGEI